MFRYLRRIDCKNQNKCKNQYTKTYLLSHKHLNL